MVQKVLNPTTLNELAIDSRPPSRRDILKIPKRIVQGTATGAIVVALLACASLSRRPYQYPYDISLDHPVLGREIMDWRDFYVSTGVGQHNAIDWPGFDGEPIIASADGVIHQRVDYQRIGGTNLVLRHRGEYRTIYYHLSGFNPNLHIGEKVNRGEIIAFVGATGEGIYSGFQHRPHLDFKFAIHPPQHSDHKLFDPMLFGVLQPFIPLYDLEAKLDVELYLRPIALQELKDTLDKKLGDYDGPERKELKRTRHDTEQMKKLLKRYTMETSKHIPGSPIYRLMLETFVYASPASMPVLLTHPLMDLKNPIYRVRYDKGSNLYAQVKK